MAVLSSHEEPPDVSSSDITHCICTPVENTEQGESILLPKLAFMNRTRLSKNDALVVAGNITGDVLYEWEYYYDYLDPVIVDASKLKYNKYSIVIILWISLVAFVGFLFLTLNLMSVTGSMPKRKLRRNETYRESTA